MEWNKELDVPRNGGRGLGRGNKKGQRVPGWLEYDKRERSC